MRRPSGKVAGGPHVVTVVCCKNIIMLLFLFGALLPLNLVDKTEGFNLKIFKAII